MNELMTLHYFEICYTADGYSQYYVKSDCEKLGDRYILLPTMEAKPLTTLPYIKVSQLMQVIDPYPIRAISEQEQPLGKLVFALGIIYTSDKEHIATQKLHTKLLEKITEHYKQSLAILNHCIAGVAECFGTPVTIK